MALFESSLKSLSRIGRGKVRDLYAVNADRMLIVASDRLSAFDVVLPDPIPDKGRVLTGLANFWFARLGHVAPNHLTGVDPESVVQGEEEKAQVRGRAVVVRRLKPLPVEAVVRGYLIGSGWKDYQRSGAVCGIALPKGLKQAQKLPEPIFTPATKATSGHDENISFGRMCEIVGGDIGRKVRDVSIRLYKEASEFAATRGIIVADTKFEFGWNILAQQTLMAQLDRKLGPGRQFWTDGWDGYPAARRRLLEFVGSRKISNPVVIGGDVHMHWVADLKRDFDDDKSPVVASEFCGTSISSQGGSQKMVDALVRENPHVRYGRSDQRGYVRASIAGGRFNAELIGLETVKKPDARAEVLARFAVEDGRPGPQPG